MFTPEWYVLIEETDDVQALSAVVTNDNVNALEFFEDCEYYLEYDDESDDDIVQTFATQTPLTLACLWSNTIVVKWLLEIGADPNKTVEDYTALHVASRVGSYECTRMLLQAGTNPNTRTKRQQVPLDLLRYCGTYDDNSCKSKYWEKCFAFSVLHVRAGLKRRSVFDNATLEVFALQDRCRVSVLTLLGIRRFRTSILNDNARDVTRLIALALWEQRTDDAWEE